MKKPGQMTGEQPLNRLLAPFVPLSARRTGHPYRGQAYMAQPRLVAVSGRFEAANAGILQTNSAKTFGFWYDTGMWFYSQGGDEEWAATIFACG
jgi:hypothetical protein